MSFARDFERQLNRTGRPVTAILVGAMALSFVLAWFTQNAFFVQQLAFLGWSKPWTILTYPFASAGFGGMFVYLLLELFWLWQIGGEVEQVVGGRRYAIFFFLATIIGALGVTLGHLFTGGSVFAPLYTPLLPIGAITIAWANRSPNACVRMMAVIPITAFWLAWIYAGIVLFNYGQGAPVVGVCALLPLAFAWVFADNRIPNVPYSAVVAEKRSKLARQRAEVFENQVRNRKQDREERERLRKLFEGSIRENGPFEDK